MFLADCQIAHHHVPKYMLQFDTRVLEIYAKLQRQANIRKDCPLAVSVALVTFFFNRIPTN